MVFRHTRFGVLLPDNTPPRHCDNPSDFNDLASMLPKAAVLYGFHITHFLWPNIIFFPTQNSKFPLTLTTVFRRNTHPCPERSRRDDIRFTIPEPLILNPRCARVLARPIYTAPSPLARRKALPFLPYLSALYGQNFQSKLHLPRVKIKDLKIFLIPFCIRS
jgi:hypothetical protein